MWKSLFEFIQTVITLSQEQNRNRADIKDQQNQITHLILKIQTLQDQIVLSNERHQAEIVLLKKDLEIEILKLRQELNLRPSDKTKTLPPATDDSQEK